MKKVLPFIAIMIHVFGQDHCSAREPTCYIQDPCERCYCLGPSQVIINPPALPRTCDGDFSIMVAGLYWKANQDGMEYAVDTSVLFNVLFPFFRESNNLIDAKYLTPNFEWRLGSKLGASYSFSCDGWSIGFLWTHFSGKASSHVHTESSFFLGQPSEQPADNHLLIALFSAFQSSFAFMGPYSGPVVLDIKTGWNLDLDFLDLSLKRKFWVSRYLTVRPNIGLRYGSAYQKYHLEHKGGELGASFIQPNLNDYVDLENDYSGAGILAGIDTNWHLGCGWCLWGNLAASILYGHFDINHNEYTRNAESPFTKTRILETKDYFRASRAIVDLALGIEYSTLFCDCNYGFTAQLGWEHHLLFHQNQMWRVNRKAADDMAFPNLTGENNHEQRRGTLETHGFTLSLRLDF